MRGHESTVVLPHTRLDPVVVQALRHTGYDVTFYDVSADDEAYWRMFRDLWAREQTFVSVEHDIVVRPDTIDELLNCPSRWCSFDVSYVNQHYAGLSCVKFTAALIASVPDAIERIASLDGDRWHPPKHWCRLDSWIQGVLDEAGETMCKHRPPLGHVRDCEVVYGTEWRVAPSHGCYNS